MPIAGHVVPFTDHCGIEFVDFDGQRSRLRLALQPHHANSLGIAHGGLICTLLDVAMGSAARRGAGHTVVTLDMNTSFLRPGRGVLLADGRVVRAGLSIVFCEAEIRDEAGEVVARATGTMRVVRRSGGQPADGA